MVIDFGESKNVKSIHIRRYLIDIVSSVSVLDCNGTFVIKDNTVIIDWIFQDHTYIGRWSFIDIIWFSGSTEDDDWATLTYTIDKFTYTPPN